MSKISKKTRKMSQNSHAALVRLTTTAMMVALAIVFARVLGFPQNGDFRIEISFLPIAVVAMLYGPLWSAAAYGLADFIGALLYTGVNPFILICKVVYGLALGLIFYKKEKIGFARNILFFIVGGFLIDVLMMMPIWVFMWGNTWGQAFYFRIIGYAVNTPVRIIVLAVADKYLFPALRKHLFKEKYSNAKHEN